jgi:hypothetical protein
LKSRTAIEDAASIYEDGIKFLGFREVEDHREQAFGIAEDRLSAEIKPLMMLPAWI